MLTLKSDLLVFGHISRLKVNLEKSNIYGINLEQNHLSRLTELLDCKVFWLAYTLPRSSSGRESQGLWLLGPSD